MDYSVIILSYYKANRISTCLQSIANCLDADDELIVVDNSVRHGKEDEEVRTLLKEFAVNHKQPVPVHLIFNEDNVRFSRGMNIGIEKSTKPFVFLVNNDTEIIDPKTFRILADHAASSSDIASVTPVTVQSHGGVYCSGAAGSGTHNRDKIKKLRISQWNNFAFVCLKREVLDKIGLLATGRTQVNGRVLNCRHYHSDEEWCRRATKNGYKHFVNPVHVLHFYREG